MKKSILIVKIVTLLFFMLSFGCLAQYPKGNKGNLSSSLDNNSNTYIIDGGDILEIITWKEPELSKEEVLVRTDGKISFPFLDDLQAAGLTPIELKQKIEAGLKKYVEFPYVTVQVKKPDSKRIYILGEVLKTGEYPLEKRLTVLQAFALAGGFTEWASKKEIILLRYEDGKEKIYRVDYRKIIDGKDLSNNLVLRPHDTIIVP
jgi:polysaccharide export outer membrane protein